MDFQQSLIFNEFKAIAAAGDTGARWGYSVALYASGVKVNLFGIQQIVTEADYTRAFRDKMKIDVVLSEGEYLYTLLPNRRQLTLTLVRTALTEQGTALRVDGETQMLPFNAYLNDAGGPEDPNVLFGGEFHRTAKEADLNGVRRVRLELVDPIAMAIQGWSMGVNFRKSTLLKALRGLVHHFGGLAAQSVGYNLIGAQIDPPKNTATYNHILFPHGTLLIDALDLLHRDKGVYSSGFSHYYHQQYWYVFPLYDVTRYSTHQRTLTIYNIPPNKLPHIERTFRRIGKAVSVLSTGLVSPVDDTEFAQLNGGNGVRYADAGRLMDTYVTGSNGRAQIDASQNINEFITDPRADGFEQVRSPQRLTANQFYQTSKLAATMVQTYRVVWENSDPSVLYPGMPVRVIQMRDGEQEVFEGILAGAQHITKSDGLFSHSQIFTSNSELHCYLSKTPQA